MATHYLEFEKPIAELDAKIAELSLLAPVSYTHLTLPTSDLV